MKHWLRCIICLSAPALWAQTTVQTATTSEVDFIEHMLASIASPDHDPSVSKLNEDNLVRLYGFNSLESAGFHSVGQAFGEAIRNYQAQLASTDQSVRASARAQVDSVITALANQILTSVRAEKAEMIKVYSSKVAAATTKGGN